MSRAPSRRGRHCFSMDENVLNELMKQTFLSQINQCKSTSSLNYLQLHHHEYTKALHTSELCRIALEINVDNDDQVHTHKDRLNCSCARKKYHSWPKHVTLTNQLAKNQKYHNYGLKEDIQITEQYDHNVPRCSKVSFADEFVPNQWFEHPYKKGYSTSSLSNEKSASLPCLVTVKSESSIKSSSSDNLNSLMNYNGEVEELPTPRKRSLEQFNYKYDLSSITNEFNAFDEMCQKVFPENNNKKVQLFSVEDEGETISSNKDFNKREEKQKPFDIFHENDTDVDYESTFLNKNDIDNLDGSSESSFNDELTTDSGFGRVYSLSPIFTSLQSGIEAPLFKNRIDLMLQWFSDFSDEQKNIFIQRLLGASGLPQTHMLSLKMETRLHEGCPTNCRDMLQWLPANVVYQILDFLDPVSLSSASKVNRTWYNYAVHHHLWQKFCRLPDYQLSSVRHREQLLKYTNIDGMIQWRDVFIERYCLRKNWMAGKCRIKTLVGHTQGVSCVQFDSKRIVSGSSDKTIMVWDLTKDSNYPVMTLVGHSGTVRCLQLIGDRLVSGSADNTIKVWDLSIGSDWNMAACRVTMVGHFETVRCLQVDEEKVISGSYDKTIKVWDLTTGRCKLTLRGHNSKVLCVQFDDQKIVSGSSDHTIKVWSLFTGVCLATFHGHQDAVTCLQFNRCHIISGSLDCTLKFWDLNSGQCVGTIDWIRSEGHTRVVRCLQADSWKIVSAGDDKTLKIWSLESGERFVTLHKHTDGVTCLRFDDFMIVSGSYDKTVKVWDFLP